MIWLYGHWLSCNLGDRQQARGIFRYLLLHSEYFASLRSYAQDVRFVNFSGDITAMTAEIDGITYPVSSPEDVRDDNPNLIILLTGSIDYMATWIPHLSHQLNKSSLKEVIIWGGFGHGKKDGIFREGLTILNHPKVSFWCRSQEDKEMVETWLGKEEGSIRLAGDPIVTWNLLFNERKVEEREEGGRKEKDISIIIIPSIYALDYYSEAWLHLREIVRENNGRVISIDNVGDRQLISTFPEIEYINNPEILLPILQRAKLVISGRLHGGVLSAVSGISTILLITDNSRPGEGTYKFHAVAETGANKPICVPLRANEIIYHDYKSLRDLTAMNYLLAWRNYLSLTQESLRIIKRRCDENLSHIQDILSCPSYPTDTKEGIKGNGEEIKPRVAIIAWSDEWRDQIKIAGDEILRQGYLPQTYHPTTFLQTDMSFFTLILIWNRQQGLDILPTIRQRYTGRIAFFNWDDPHSQKEVLSRVMGIDDVYSSCQSTRENYLSAGVKRWHYLPPFYGDWHYPELDNKYSHDISLVCTNLYEDYTEFPGQLVSRFNLVRALDASDLDFGLYGPAYLGSLFPKSYRGEISYADNHKVFSASRINLSTHVTNGNCYTNERCITILASGGLLLVDPINGWEKLFGDRENGEGTGCIVTRSCNIPDIISQIHDILKNYNDYLIVRKRGREIVRQYHISEWVRKVLEG